MAMNTQKTADHMLDDASKSREAEPKVGSDRSAAEHFAGKRDFGIPAEGAGRFTEVAEEAKYQPGGDHLIDPRPARSGGQSNRESGVGGVSSGAGSSSGGDLDTDIIGVGTHGSGISSSGPDTRKGGSDMTSSGTPKHADHPNKPSQKMRGSTVNKSGGDSTTGSGLGSGGLLSADAGDDAAAGEISEGEAGGDDNTDADNVSSTSGI